jgi:hypothetical protein
VQFKRPRSDGDAKRYKKNRAGGIRTKGVLWNRTGFTNDTRKVGGVESGRINFVPSNFEKSLIRIGEKRRVGELFS